MSGLTTVLPINSKAVTALTERAEDASLQETMITEICGPFKGVGGVQEWTEQVLANLASEVIGHEQLIRLMAGQIEHLAAIARDLGEQLQETRKRARLVIYRGVHVVGEVYDTGEMVTCGGSLWHCNEITEEKPGDGSSAWTLAVKRGRDGKDLTRGAA